MQDPSLNAWCTELWCTREDAMVCRCCVHTLLVFGEGEGRFCMPDLHYRLTRANCGQTYVNIACICSRQTVNYCTAVEPHSLGHPRDWPDLAIISITWGWEEVQLGQGGLGWANAFEASDILDILIAGPFLCLLFIMSAVKAQSLPGVTLSIFWS